MSFPRRPLVGVLVAATALSLAACGSDDDDSAQPPVPAIENPRDARNVDPCTLLSGEQLAQFGLSGSPRPSRTADGLPRCDWGVEGATTAWVQLFTTGDGLQTLTANSDPTTARVRLANYPALETYTEAGAFCQYDVGQAPGQAVMAAMTGGAPDSCTALQPLVTVVLNNLPPYQG